MTSTRTRTGCDLQQIDEVGDAVAEFGARYLDRVYTPLEQQAGDRGGAASLAARFAAKEAVLKLIGTADGVDPRSIEIGEDPDHARRPTVRLSGLAAELADRAGLGPIDVSLSHTRDLAMAVVVAVATSPDPLGQDPSSQETPNR